jgi:hypothetical protein
LIKLIVSRYGKITKWFLVERLNGLKVEIGKEIYKNIRY